MVHQYSVYPASACLTMVVKGLRVIVKQKPKWNFRWNFYEVGIGSKMTHTVIKAE